MSLTHIPRTHRSSLPISKTPEQLNAEMRADRQEMLVARRAFLLVCQDAEIAADIRRQIADLEQALER